MGLFLIAAVLLASAAQASPAPAGAAPGTAAPVAQSATSSRRNCGAHAPKQQPSPEARSKAGEAAAGVVAGAVIGGLLGARGVPIVTTISLPVQAFLADKYIDMLECGEQLKAIGATLQVTHQAERQGVGTSVTWRSDTRPGVTGASTVTAVERAGAGGRRCLTVTDVLIIDGEETTVPKRMCRTPPSDRYQRV